MRFTVKLIASLLLATVLFTDAFIVANATDNDDAVSEYIDRFSKETGCNAISVVVVENGEARYYEGLLKDDEKAIWL